MRTGFDPFVSAFTNILLPSIVIRGERSTQSLRRSAEILSGALANASLRTISEAGHFMTATHAAELAELVRSHVSRVESLAWTSICMDSAFPFYLPDVRRFLV
jgi:hypothetical protein